MDVNQRIDEISTRETEPNSFENSEATIILESEDKTNVSLLIRVKEELKSFIDLLWSDEDEETPIWLNPKPTENQQDIQWAISKNRGVIGYKLDLSFKTEEDIRP